MSALGIWLWRNLLSFGGLTGIKEANHCAASSVFVVIIGKGVPMGAEALRVCSLILYALFLIPGLNLILPMVLFLFLYSLCHKHSLTGEN